MKRRLRRTIPAILILAWIMGGAAGAQDFGDRTILIDPALKGWVAPLQTLLFQVGCGELYSVAGIYLGESAVLSVVSRSKGTLRRFEQGRLQRYANKLAEALSPVVADLRKRKAINGVVLTFYSPHLAGNVLHLEIHESCLPAGPAGLSVPVSLCLSERRTEEMVVP